MTSPSPRSVVRRRQRSTRLTVAVGLLVLATALVLGAIATGRLPLVLLSALAALVLGAASTKITHAELVQTRLDAAQERAEQAQAYRELTEQRTAENVAFAKDMRSRIAEREETIALLETELGKAMERAATATLKMNSEARRAELAEAEGLKLSELLEDSETRATEAGLKVTELTAELDALRAELEAWQAAELHYKRA